MVHLVSVHDQFHARVLAARLGSDGIVTELRPPPGGPYPLLGEVQLYVGEADLALARELLRADALEADEPTGPPPPDPAGGAAERPALLGPGARVVVAVALLAALVLLTLSRAG